MKGPCGIAQALRYRQPANIQQEHIQRARTVGNAGPEVKRYNGDTDQ